MNAFRPLTRIAGLLGGQGRRQQLHAVAGGPHGAGVLAAHPRERDRAGLLPDASRTAFLLTDKETGELTPRGPDDHRATRRWAASATPEDLLGAVLWLLSPASAFVTGIVVPDRRRLLGLQRRVSTRGSQSDGHRARATPTRYLCRRATSAASSPRGSHRRPSTASACSCIIPDGTRTMPMPLMFEALERALGPRAAALDYLVALGTHQPMTDEQLSRLVGRPVVGRPGRAQPRSSTTAGTTPARSRRSARFPAAEIAALTGGLLDARRAGVAQPAGLRLRPDPHLRPGASRTRWSASPAATSTSSPASPAPRSSTSRTGSARSSRATAVIGAGYTPVRAVIDRAACAASTGPITLPRARRDARRRRRALLRHAAGGLGGGVGALGAARTSSTSTGRSAACCR